MNKEGIFQELNDYWNSNMYFNQLFGLKITHFNTL